MRPSKDLAVKPVKRYRKPKYPSHQDPDPTLDPSATPYPISNKFVSTLAAMATVVSTSCSSPEQQTTATDAAASSTKSSATQEQSKSQSAKPDQRTVARLRSAIEKEAMKAGVPTGPVNFRDLLYAYEKEQNVDRKKEREEYFEQSMGSIQETPFSPPEFVNPSEVREHEFREMLISEAGGNPLCVAVSGLPHQTSPYGTGVPNYVDADFARRVIEKVFSDAGYTMLKDVQYDRDHVAIKLDGYDAKKKVGFVVADWGNLEGDVLVRWHLPQTDDSVAGQVDVLEQSITLATASESEKQIVSDIQAARKQADSAKRNAAFKSILDRYSKSFLSLEEIEQLESRALDGSEFIAVISAFDNRFIEPWNFGLDRREWREEFAKTTDLQSPDIDEKYEKFEAKKKAQAKMAELEKAAREYIQWAQTQGLQ